MSFNVIKIENVAMKLINVLICKDTNYEPILKTRKTYKKYKGSGSLYYVKT